MSTKGTPRPKARRISSGSKRKIDDVNSSNQDADDPFNFHTKGDHHPEPLKNISVCKSISSTTVLYF